LHRVSSGSFAAEQQTVAGYAVNFCSSPMRRRGLPSQQSVPVTDLLIT
jgi:hypothetical protein